MPFESLWTPGQIVRVLCCRWPHDSVTVLLNFRADLEQVVTYALPTQHFEICAQYEHSNLKLVCNTSTALRDWCAQEITRSSHGPHVVKIYKLRDTQNTKLACDMTQIGSKERQAVVSRQFVSTRQGWQPGTATSVDSTRQVRAYVTSVSAVRSKMHPKNFVLPSRYPVNVLLTLLVYPCAK